MQKLQWGFERWVSRVQAWEKDPIKLERELGNCTKHWTRSTVHVCANADAVFYRAWPVFPLNI